MELKSLKIDIDAALVDGFTAYADSLGMKNRAIGERLIAWFLAQPEPARRYILGLVDGREARTIAALKASLSLRSAGELDARKAAKTSRPRPPADK